MDKEKFERKQSRLALLYTKKKEYENTKDGLLKDISQVQNKVDEVDRKLKRVNSDIYHIESRTILITTHALSRYRLRVNPKATDEEIEKALLVPYIKEAVRTLGNGKYPVAGTDLWVVIQDRKVISVMRRIQ